MKLIKQILKKGKINLKKTTYYKRYYYDHTHTHMPNTQIDFEQ